MTSIKIFTYVVGTMACLSGLLLCSTLLFPSFAMEHGVTDEGLKAQFIIYVMWMALFAVSLHVYVEETRRKR
jgi:hypothetical protein